ncbi:NAD-dependent epimerase/dehydratase family protein [Rhodococcoides fascians]|uniref:NAD-dependent epimerase/dehydratase family protein n=1 Tax=Rhodococcoides fascians TaxID=1828 RepID=UPI000B13E67F|nr:NAD-dependent epimerase/dehydratase family protein [Rhodococcus fascians]WQH29463.1 NAD-dependent epimerase/dehydratase family protein [Rhodococcus fascians]
MSPSDRGVAAPRVVLVTGASRFLGGYLVTRLAQNPRIERVIAVDEKSPSKDLLRRMGRAEFVRADIRNPLIGKVIRNAGVDTVVHAATVAKPPKSGGRATMKDLNVIGAMQLFAVCQKSPTVEKVVLRSSSSVYGCSAKDPVKFTEEMSARRPPSGAYAKDTIDIEGYIRGLGRRRPDIAVSILRMAPLIGPRLNGTISRYMTSPLIPSIVGRDARMQLLHEEDALAALERATIGGPAGTFNIGADGTIMLSQAIRRAGRVQVPVPFPLFKSVGRALMGGMMREFTTEQLDYFHFGCGLDTTRMRSVLGFEPRWTTVQAFDDFVRGAALRPVVRTEWVDAIENRLLGAVDTGASAARVLATLGSADTARESGADR